MTATVLNQNVAIVSIPEDQQCTVTIAAVGTALIQRIYEESILETVSMTAGQTRVFGEYLVDEILKISCLTGSLTYNVAQRTRGNATTTNDSATAGQIGELKTTAVTSGAAVVETTASSIDVCTLTLTPGDWDVSAVVDRTLAGTTATIFGAGISLTANTMPPEAGGSGLGTDAEVSQSATFGVAITGNFATAIPPVRLSIAADTVVHLVAADTFSAGTVSVFGTIRARRMR